LIGEGQASPFPFFFFPELHHYFGVFSWASVSAVPTCNPGVLRVFFEFFGHPRPPLISAFFRFPQDSFCKDHFFVSSVPLCGPSFGSLLQFKWVPLVIGERIGPPSAPVFNPTTFFRVCRLLRVYRLALTNQSTFRAFLEPCFLAEAFS